jgi:D-glycero-alpha-D-manno-heptose-7-phosphate kinase
MAPTRISLFGGGTDLPVYYQKYGGMTISFAINLRQHVNIQQRIDKGGNIAITLPEKSSPDFYTKILDEFDGSYVLSSTFDAIIESGLGSSASSAVALVSAISKYKSIPMSTREIAEKAWDIEVNKLGLYGGKQDQYISAFGKFQETYFAMNGNIYLNEVGYKKADMVKDYLLLFYSGENRKNSKLQENLKELNDEQTYSLHEIKRLTKYAKNAIERFDTNAIGSLLNEAWMYKKKSNNGVTNSKIDLIYNTAIDNGAMGGKLMGSGGGGFMFFWTPPNYHKNLITELEKIGCKNWDYSFDNNGVETRII